MMTVNTEDTEDETSTWEETGDGYGGPRNGRMLEDSVVKRSLTELPGVLDACAVERSRVPEGERPSGK
jgi:hypothetical protein